MSDGFSLEEIEARANELIERADVDDRMIHLADASLIVRSLADVPRLVARVRELEDELRQAEQERDEAVREATSERNVALVAFYQAAPVSCANLCDQVLDPRGALLGRVRDWAAATAVRCWACHKPFVADKQMQKWLAKNVGRDMRPLGPCCAYGGYFGAS